MATVYLDGFDDCTYAQLPRYGWVFVGGSNSIVSGRVAGSALRLLYQNPIGGSASISHDANARVTVGFAWSCTNATNSQAFLHLKEGATVHGQLAYNGNGTFTVSRNGSIPATSANMGIAANTWYYIELDYTCNDTTGAWEVRLNDTAIIGPTSSLDTRNGGTAGTIDTLLLSAGGLANHGHDFDDLYINTGATGFFGDGRIITKLPTAEAFYSEWTPSSGTDNALLVDDATANDDTDYVSADTAGQQDTYDVAALGVTGVVKAVQACVVARKDDAGSRALKHLIRISGTDYLGSKTQALSTSYAGYYEVFATNPNTSAAWLVAGVDGAEFGVEVIS